MANDKEIVYTNNYKCPYCLYEFTARSGKQIVKKQTISILKNTIICPYCGNGLKNKAGV